MKKSITSFFLVSLLLILSCSKEHAPHWIVMKVKVVDGDTGDPIQAFAQIAFKKKHTDPDDNAFSSSEGITYDGRTIVIKHKITSREYGHRIEIHLPDRNYSPICYNPYSDISFPVAPGTDKDLVLPRQRYYKYNIRLKNVNCNGPTDSVFISNGQYLSKTFAGCVDSLFYTTYTCYPFTTSHSVHLNIISKKNGITTDLSQDFPLTFGNVNELLSNIRMSS